MEIDWPILKISGFSWKTGVTVAWSWFWGLGLAMKEHGAMHDNEAGPNFLWYQQGLGEGSRW